MNVTLGIVREMLARSGYECRLIQRAEHDVLVAEDDTVIVFVFVFADVTALQNTALSHAESTIGSFQLALRRAAKKAWNIYGIFLTSAVPTTQQFAALTLLEEDLSGYRKIARASITDHASIQRALLPLLRIAAAPSLEVIDFPSEIRLRTTGLPEAAITAFLADSDEHTVLRLLEDAS